MNNNTIDILLSFCDNKKLIDLLSQYLNIPLPDIVSKMGNSLISPRLIIPVLGVQGSGKSSLLNALLMQTAVLPIDANETTCVPTEIMYSENASKLTRIIYKDGHEELVPSTEQELKKYINNNFNPSNKLNIKKVIIECNNPILEKGIVLVDLPGVGSLTKENIDATMNYIQNSVGAIFLVRTTPPITRSESIFIQTVWPGLSPFWFIQNRWNDESNEEVKDGFEHNHIVLGEIAKKCKIKADDIQVIIINIYQAFRGSLKKDENEYLASNINNLKEKLTNTASDWKNKIVSNIYENFIFWIKTTIDKIDQLKNDINKDKEEIDTELKDEEKRFSKYYNKVKDTISKTKDDIDISVRSLKLEISSLFDESSEKMRNNMRTVIRSGIVDGEGLNNAYNNYITEENFEIFSKFRRKVDGILNSIKTRFDNNKINEWIVENKFQSSNLSSKEKKKWETIIPKITAIGGTFGGAWAGAEIGALVGSVVPVLGNIIGGALGAFIGGFIGKKVKKIPEAKRRESAERLVFPIIENDYLRMKDTFVTTLDELSCDLKAYLNKWQAEQKNEYEYELKQRIDNLNNNLKNKEIHLKIFNDQKKYLSESLINLKESN